MKSKENAFTACSFIFGLIAVLMIFMPYIVDWLLHARMDEAVNNVKFARKAYYMLYVPPMMAFGFFSWVASIVLMTVNLICNRAGIKTILGYIGMTLNAVCFLYYIYVIYKVVRFS